MRKTRISTIKCRECGKKFFGENVRVSFGRQGEADMTNYYCSEECRKGRHPSGMLPNGSFLGLSKKARKSFTSIDE